MIYIEWSVTAFARLEDLPEKIAFDILDRIDRLASFPEIGTPLKHLYPRFGNCRQLIYKRSYRLIYVYEAEEQLIKILVLQPCRQQLPTISDLHRSLKEIDIEE